MKRHLLAAMLLLSTSMADARDAPLPADSVYHLPARLVDQGGHRIAWPSLRGKPRLVAMFYTSCRYICPLIVDSGKAVERQLAPAQQARLGIVLVSIDPARDTPAALKQVMDQRRLDAARWTLLAPRADDVRNLAGVLGVRYRQLADGEFNHTSALVLLDAEGRILARSERMGAQPDPEFVAAVRRATTAKN